MKALLLLFSIGGFACAEITIEKFESAPARVSEISVSNNLLYAGTMKGDVVILDTGGNIVARISQRMPVRKIVPLSESLFVRETDRITVVNQSGKELWSSPDNVVSCLIERTNFRSILFARRNEVEECDFDGKSLRKVKIHGNPSGILVGPENVFVFTENDSFKTAGYFNLPNGKEVATFCDLKIALVRRSVTRENGDIVSIGIQELVISDGTNLTKEFPRGYKWSSLLKCNDDSIVLVTMSGQVFTLRGK